MAMRRPERPVERVQGIVRALPPDQDDAFVSLCLCVSFLVTAAQRLGVDAGRLVGVLLQHIGAVGGRVQHVTRPHRPVDGTADVVVLPETLQGPRP
ncbi:hypothetical protein Tdes44962_MAKER00648 [Teratosphaeria destructans]|uniref:Uncharacterized protein n=1 Tax=Teratosphaeria destructans TaxID=418781 RepID=A0A9W7SP14_9PEZI|nr:hypothetical protein Tdes44962_MAKER00648 [Teratosphaeria destructans]